MQPYPSYLDSGVDWLGELPVHWSTAQLRRRLAIVSGGTPPSSDDECWGGDIVWVTPEDLGRNAEATISGSRRMITEHGVEASSANVCPAGSVVLSTRAPIGHLAIASTPVTTNQGCRTLVPKGDIDSRYAYYAVGVSEPVLQALGKGSTFMELSSTDLGAHRVPLPPLHEQIAISSYLGRETARIDSLIARQRELVEHLDEYCSALVTHTVTHGLPPEAAAAAGLAPTPQMKPSGVDWLGDVPKHWEVRSFRYVCRLAYGDSLPSGERTEGDVPVFGSNGVVGFHEVANTLAPAIIVGRKGSHGKVTFARQPSFAIDTTFYVDERSCDSNLRWLFYALSSADLDDVSQDSAVPGLSRDDAYAKCLPHPPLTEQAAIARYLDAKVALVNDAISNTESRIERLYEYRSALISAAVTGKMDVRDAASPASEVAA